MNCRRASIAVAGLAVAVAFVITVACTPASATSTVSATPGTINVKGGFENNDYLVEDSKRIRNAAPVRAGALLASKPAYEAIKMQVESFTVEGATKATGGILLAVSAFLLVLTNPDELDEDLESDGALKITDRSGAPIVTAQPCRHDVRDERHPGTILLNSVVCPALLSDTGRAPILGVMAGSGNDRIEFNLDCLTCLAMRAAYGQEGDDTLIGSHFDDELLGGIENDRIYGRDGKDQIIGGVPLGFVPEGIADSDSLWGGGDSDTVWGGADNDLVVGGPGNDLGPIGSIAALSGGSGDDTVVGGRGADAMESGDGKDTMLAKESDFGSVDEPDPLVDCIDGGPIEKVVRYSPSIVGSPRPYADGLLFCPTSQYYRPITALELRAWVPGTPWSWDVP